MGSGYKIVCECRHSQNIREGCGMLCFLKFREIEEKIKSGKMGKKKLELSKQYVNTSARFIEKAYYCPKCKKIKVKKDYTFTFNNPVQEGFPKEVVIAENKHKCKKCGSELVEFEFGEQEVLCPVCGKKINMDNVLYTLWD